MSSPGDSQRPESSFRLPLQRASDGRAVLVASRASARRRRRLVRTVRMQHGGPSGGRYLPAYSTAGPKVRLGIAWFVIAFGALWLGRGPAGLLYGVAAALGVTQAAAAWRRRGWPLAVAVVAFIGFVLPMAAAAGATALGLAVLLGVALAFVVGALASYAKSANLDHLVREAAQTLRVGFFVGFGAAALVLLRGVGRSHAVMVLVLVSAYEAGDYLVGSGSGNHLEGPVAGALGVFVVTFALAVAEPFPWQARDVWSLGVLAVLACPLGPVLGSIVLPDGRAFAPGLRRLDSLILFGPTALIFTQMAL